MERSKGRCRSFGCAQDDRVWVGEGDGQRQRQTQVPFGNDNQEGKGNRQKGKGEIQGSFRCAQDDEGLARCRMTRIGMVHNHEVW